MLLSSLLRRYFFCMATGAFLSLVAPAFGYDLLMFGDSITQGLKRNAYLLIYGITSPPNGARVDGSYGPKLERLLESSETSFAYNWGWGGEVTKTGVNRIDGVLVSRPADYILILEGANDLIGGLSAETTTTNLAIMIDKARSAGIEPILSDLTPFSCPVECNADGRVALLNTKVAALAEEKNVVLSMVHAPLEAGWETTYTSGDGIHLNDDGYAIMADSWYEAIMKATGRNIAPVLQLLLLKE